MCMEFADKGCVAGNPRGSHTPCRGLLKRSHYSHHSSLDGVYKAIGPIAEDVLGKIAFAVVSGLTYLYDAHRIIHRGEHCYTD